MQFNTTPEANFKCNGAAQDENEPDRDRLDLSEIGYRLGYERVPVVNGVVQMKPRPAALTIISNGQGLATKQFHIAWDDWLHHTGKVVKTSAAQIFKGEGDRALFYDIAEADALMNGLASHQAIIAGVFAEEHVEIVTQGMLNGGGEVARDRAHTSYRKAEPGLFPWDHDPIAGDAPLPPAELDRILWEVWPEIRGTDRMYRPSASARITVPDGVEPPPPGGLHGYMLVPDASLIPQIGEELFMRLWIGGHGRVIVGEAGQLLVRSVIDVSVYQPERLFFEAAPHLGNPHLKHRKIQPKEVETTFYRGSRYFNPYTPDGIGAVDRALYAEMVEAEKRKLKPQAAKKQRAFIDKVMKEAVARGTPVKRDTLLRAIKTFTLGADFPITMPDGTKKSVGDIVADPDTYHGMRIPDPLEPSYGNDKRIAVIYLDKKPLIYSWAHGSSVYKLEVNAPEAEDEDDDAMDAPQWTDPAIALLAAERYKDKLRYVDAWRSWHFYDGTRWQKDQQLYAYSRFREVCIATSKEIMELAKRERDDGKQAKLKTAAKAMASGAKIQLSIL